MFVGIINQMLKKKIEQILLHTVFFREVKLKERLIWFSQTEKKNYQKKNRQCYHKKTRASNILDNRNTFALPLSVCERKWKEILYP